MRRLLAAMTLLLVAPVGVQASAAPPPAPIVQQTQTGTCSTAWVIFWQNSAGSGGMRRYCSGVNDSNMQTELTTNNMGPLDDGTYKPDFDSAETTSGISRIQFQSYSQNQILCMYDGPGQSGSALWLEDTVPGNNSTHQPLAGDSMDNKFGAFYIYTANFCP